MKTPPLCDAPDPVVTPPDFELPENARDCHFHIFDSPSKQVHLDAEIRRCDSGNNLITSFRSLWVIVEINGTWAAKIRSSFAQQ